jgi:hypothetical protein
MRALLLLSTLLLPCALTGQTPPPTTPPSTLQLKSDLRQALVGDWVGVLEYRDYSEPATSTKRVELPTWLSITPSADAQLWHYIYDDGPTKVVEESDNVTFDPAASIYSESANGKPPQLFKVSGYDTLRSGRGQLILSGAGTDNDKPAETRVTITIRRNLLEILEETRPAASTEPFAFRHAFRFTRAKPPTPPPAAK